MKSLFFTCPSGQNLEQRAIANMLEKPKDQMVHKKPESQRSQRKKIVKPHHDWLMPSAGTSK